MSGPTRLEEQVSDGVLDKDTMAQLSASLDGTNIRLRPPAGSNAKRGEQVGMSFKEFASKTQEGGAIQELAAAMAKNKPARRPWSRSVVVPPPPFESDVSAQTTAKRSQYRTHSEMMQARQMNEKRSAMKQLQDLPTKYKRSHLHLRDGAEALVFFAKEY